MTMYIYEREDGSLVEIEHPMSQDALTNCPTTGQPMTRVPQRFGSRSAFGLGFYKDAKREALARETAPPA
jgi:predicted nucleic acid-binding Zn ribbon protein